MVKDYLNALKNKVGITCAEWSNLSDVPEATIRKILSGDTSDPRFETIVRLVTSVGGSLDDILGGKKQSEIENSAINVLKEAYESRIEALRERVADVKSYAESLHRDKIMLAVTVAALVAILVGILIFDICVGSHGWVQY